MKNKKIWVAHIWETQFVEHDDELKIGNEYDVIVKNHYTHLSAGTEMACLSGLESWFQIPASPGYTGIGEVISKGAAVDKVNVGDMVFTYSTHSQYYKLNITDRWHGVCVKLPENVNAQWASFTHMAGIAMTAIRNSRIELGDFVLVAGQGVIGNLAAQLAKLQGANVIVSDISENRLAVSKACGLDITVNSSHENLSEKIRSFTNGKGVDTFIDATGLAKVIDEFADSVAWNGEIILLGSPRSPFETNITRFLGHFHYLPFNHTLKGALEFSFPTHQTDFNKHSIERNAEIILRLIAEEKLKIQPFYSHKLSPRQSQSAYEGLRDKSDEYMGVVFDWTNI
jgi:2-desacetyl-2-hydroxyethyl bacteriochlorophyllide A dehydrogenase